MTNAPTTTTTTAPPSPGPDPSGHLTTRFAQRLDAEWQHLRRSRRSLRLARSWADGDPDHPLAAVVAAIDDLDDLVAATQRGCPAADAILLRLVELARHDELAGRIVIQRLLPALVSRSVSYRCFHDGVDPVSISVPAAWLAVRAYDTTRRRHQVAASLLSDAVFTAFRQPLRRRSAGEVIRPAGTFIEMTAEPAPSGIEELAAVVREARTAGVPDHDLELIRELARAESPRLVAADRRVTPRTVRNHRDRAVARVRLAIAA
jgi:hypothetical protein